MVSDRGHCLLSGDSVHKTSPRMPDQHSLPLQGRLPAQLTRLVSLVPDGKYSEQTMASVKH